MESYSPKSTPGYDEFDMKTLSLLNVETQYGFDALSGMFEIFAVFFF